MGLTAYGPLSSVYFFYFAVLGAIHPYWGLYLQSLAFSADEIGMLMAIFIATKLIAPNLWSYLADRRQAHIPVMRLGALLTPLCFLTVYLQQGLMTMALAMVLFSFFWNAILPQYEVITLRAIAGQEERYSQIRLWGSIGFIVAVAGLGLLLDRFDVRWLPVSVLVIMLLMTLSSWWIPPGLSGGKKAAQYTDKKEEFSLKQLLYILLKPSVTVFLTAVILMQLSHGPYYTFFSIYMEEVGYSRSTIGMLWALGVIAEVVLFAIMHLLLRRYKAEHILLVSLMLAGVRWSLTGYFAAVLPVLLLLQLLHAATFAAFHSASIVLVQRFFPGALAAQGQAVYSSLGFGIGGALGAWLSGLLWQQAGAQFSYLAAGLMAAIGALFVALSLWKQRQHWLAKNDCKV